MDKFAIAKKIVLNQNLNKKTLDHLESSINPYKLNQNGSPTIVAPETPKISIFLKAKIAAKKDSPELQTPSLSQLKQTNINQLPKSNIVPPKIPIIPKASMTSQLFKKVKLKMDENNNSNENNSSVKTEPE